jgi:hypothetical protein
MFSHLFRRLRQAPSGKRPLRRPFLEALEDRALPATVYGLTPGNILIRFDSATPGTIQAAVNVTGLGLNETLRGIDFRPRTGQLIGSTVTTGSANNSVVRTYRINPLTGAATLIGATAAALAGAGDVPTGFDFNPTVDRIRYVNTNDENARLNPNNGALAGNDTDLNPAAEVDIIAEAYDRNFDRPNAAGVPTTLYGINRANSNLVLQGGLNGGGPGGPNAGTITNVGPLGVELTAGSEAGFDIADSTANGGLGTALAALTVADATGLYTINLTTGAATLVGNIGSGQTQMFGLAVVPDGQVIVGAGPGAGPQVRSLDPATGAQRLSFEAFANFNGGVRVATGDINRDGIPDIVAAAVTANGHLRVFDGTTGAMLPGAIGNFLAFPNFNGTVNVAVGDVNGDTFGDVIVVANGAQGHVKAFSGADGSLIANFLAFQGFFGDVTVSAGDFDNAGTDQIVAAAASNGHVKVLNANGTIFTGAAGNFVGSFLSFQNFAGGVNVAAGDVNGDGLADIIVGTGAGTAGHVKAFNLNGSVNQLTNFLAFESAFTGGASVGVGDFNRDGLYDIAATPGPGRQSVVRFFNLTAVELGVFDAFPGSTAGATVGGIRF